MKPLLAAALILAASTAQALTIREAAGPTPADIQSAVNAFRADLGTANGNLPENFVGGRREINWDGVPDAFADPNLFPGDFFNGSTPGRARGVAFSTPGTGFLVSATAASGQPTNFGFPSDFLPFTAERLFSSVGSNVLDVQFFDPADQTTMALSAGFGAVFSDVEVAGLTSLAFFDAQGGLLLERAVLTSVSGGFSFLGASFDAPLVARVRMTLGDSVLLANGDFGSGVDGVVVDDFIFGEPTSVAPVPLPPSALMLAGALVAAGLIRRRV